MVGARLPGYQGSFNGFVFDQPIGCSVDPREIASRGETGGRYLQAFNAAGVILHPDGLALLVFQVNVSEGSRSGNIDIIMKGIRIDRCQRAYILRRKDLDIDQLSACPSLCSRSR